MFFLKKTYIFLPSPHLMPQPVPHTRKARKMQSQAARPSVYTTQKEKLLLHGIEYGGDAWLTANFIFNFFE